VIERAGDHLSPRWIDFIRQASGSPASRLCASKQKEPAARTTLGDVRPNRISPRRVVRARGRVCDVHRRRSGLGRGGSGIQVGRFDRGPRPGLRDLPRPERPGHPQRLLPAHRRQAGRLSLQPAGGVSRRHAQVRADELSGRLPARQLPARDRRALREAAPGLCTGGLAIRLGALERGRRVWCLPRSRSSSASSGCVGAGRLQRQRSLGQHLPRRRCAAPVGCSPGSAAEASQHRRRSRHRHGAARQRRRHRPWRDAGPAMHDVPRRPRHERCRRAEPGRASTPK
jgi:hypothetical protein